MYIPAFHCTVFPCAPQDLPCCWIIAVFCHLWVREILTPWHSGLRSSWNVLNLFAIFRVWGSFFDRRTLSVRLLKDLFFSYCSYVSTDGCLGKGARRAEEAGGAQLGIQSMGSTRKSLWSFVFNTSPFPTFWGEGQLLIFFCLIFFKESPAEIIFSPPLGARHKLCLFLSSASHLLAESDESEEKLLWKVG